MNEAKTYVAFDDTQARAGLVSDCLWPFETIEEAGLALAEEAGEVAKAIIKRNHALRGEGDRASADWTANLQVELAQVVVVAMKMADREEFSLWDAIQTELSALDARWEAKKAGICRPGQPAIGGTSK